MMVTRYFYAPLLLVLLSIAPAADALDEPYNAGVDAWKKKDYAQAANQWSLAVLAGNVDAMNNLAYLYFNGLGLKSRVSDAIRLWRIAGFAGHSEAQWHLGAAYENGTGVEKDPVKAYAWYRCAVESAKRKKASDSTGIEARIEDDAARSMHQLMTQMSPSDLARASGVADEYIRRYGTAPP
jgi:Sel1 repeat